MNLIDYELLPGVVVSVKDDECLGRVKVALPGGESPSNTQIDAMPWCYPMYMTGTYQGFTKLVENSKVWVLRNKVDRLEMWYWPMVDLNPNTQAIVDTYDNPDVLVSRDLGGKNVYIYYTDGHGIVLSIGGSKININAKGEINLSTGSGNLKVIGDNILLNTDETSDNQVAKFEPIKTAIDKIKDCLEALQQAANGSSFTKHLSGNPAFTKNMGELNKLITTKNWGASETVFTN